MLNAPLSSFPRQELICEIIYPAVYFRHWEDALLIAPHTLECLRWLRTGSQRHLCTFHVQSNVLTSRAGFNTLDDVNLDLSEF